MSLTLKNNGVEKSLAEWGIDDTITLRTVNLDADTLTFDIPKAGDPEIHFPSRKIELKKEGVVIFAGRLDYWRDNINTSESLTYQAAGPWYYLENVIYQQRYRTLDDGSLDGALLSNVVVGVSGSGQPVSIREALEDVFAFLRALGLPVRLGQMSSVYDDICPMFTASGLSCAEIVRRILATTPYCVAWWDYSGDMPTWQVYPYQELPVSSKAYGESNLETTALRKAGVRPAGVDIHYVYAVNSEGRRTTNTSAGARRRVDVDAWPEAIAPAQLVRRLAVTVDLSADADARPPVGLAKRYYESIPPVLWTGQITMVDGDTSGPWLGKRIKLTGSRADLAAHPCIVQSATYSPGSGTVALEVGLNAFLTPDTFVAQQKDLRTAISGLDKITSPSLQSNRETVQL